ncbi:MAG: GDSL-type esterase/lipase family protein [Patescibacteria group bacterium]
MILKAIIIFLVVYTLASGARFWFYLRRAKLLMSSTPRQDYVIAGGEKKLSVTILGDSTAVGTGASGYTKTYHYQFLERHKNNYSFDVQNKGVVGARTADLARQIESMGHSDLAIISIGGNDVTHGTEWASVERDLSGALGAVSQKAKRVVLLTPGDLGDVLIVPYPLRKYWATKSPKLSVLAARVASDKKITHIDIYALGGTQFRDEPYVYYASDLFHPSDAGYKLWADALDAKVNFE